MFGRTYQAPLVPSRSKIRQYLVLRTEGWSCFPVPPPLDRSCRKEWMTRCFSPSQFTAPACQQHLLPLTLARNGTSTEGSLSADCLCCRPAPAWFPPDWLCGWTTCMCVRADLECACAHVCACLIVCPFYFLYSSFMMNKCPGKYLFFPFSFLWLCCGAEYTEDQSQEGKGNVVAAWNS